MWSNSLQALAELCSGVSYYKLIGIPVDLNVAELYTCTILLNCQLVVLNLAEMSQALNECMQGDFTLAELYSG